MARTQQVKEKGNAHTTEYEKNTPVETQGFYVYFFLPTKCGAILRRACVFFRSRTPKYASTLQKKIDFLLDSFYTIYRLAFYYERYTNERNKGILPFDLEK